MPLRPRSEKNEKSVSYVSEFPQWSWDIGATGFKAVRTSRHGTLISADQTLEERGERRDANPASDEQSVAAVPSPSRWATIRAVEKNGHLGTAQENTNKHSELISWNILKRKRKYFSAFTSYLGSWLLGILLTVTEVLLLVTSMLLTPLSLKEGLEHSDW